MHRALASPLRVPSAAAVMMTSLAGCWVSADAGRQMQSDIAELRRELSSAQKVVDEQRAGLDEQMRTAQKQIDATSTALADLNRAARSTDADFGVQMERLIREVQELRGSVELLQYRLGKVEAGVAGPGSLTERLEALEKQVNELGSKAAAPAPVAEKLPEDSKSMFEQAARLAKDGKVEDARGVYREIVRRWPKEDGVTDQAFYRLGESYFDEKKSRAALQEYIKVLERFATGRYADDTLYKVGLCSIDIGNLEDAQIFLGEILKSHPKSPLVKSASRKLDEVKRKLATEKPAPAPAKGKK